VDEARERIVKKIHSWHCLAPEESTLTQQPDVIRKVLRRPVLNGWMPRPTAGAAAM
jgi:hypothetical protein